MHLQPYGAQMPAAREELKVHTMHWGVQFSMSAYMLLFLEL